MGMPSMVRWTSSSFFSSGICFYHLLCRGRGTLPRYALRLVLAQWPAGLHGHCANTSLYIILHLRGVMRLVLILYPDVFALFVQDQPCSVRA